MILTLRALMYQCAKFKRHKFFSSVSWVPVACTEGKKQWCRRSAAAAAAAPISTSKNAAVELAWAGAACVAAEYSHHPPTA